ncbi:hypothetical protein ABTQ10_20140, partial [Acinetobacter baumannii]
VEDATQLLRLFNTNRPVQSVEFSADPTLLEQYITTDRIHKAYPEDYELYEDEEPDVILYRSGDLLVKEWSDVHIEDFTSSDILKY